MQARKKLRILLSGPGLMGRKHAELLARSEFSELAVVVAPRTPKNVEFGDLWGAPVFVSVDAALENVDVDAAIIASPNEFHCDQALACIDHRIPALVEKPLAADLRGASLISEKSRSSGVSILVGHHRTYSALLLAARNFIGSPRFGPLVAMQGSALFRKPEHYFKEGPWRTRIGGGPLLINLIHEIGIMQYLCGAIESVSARSSNERRGFEVEDTAVINLLFENGALGSFILSDIAASNKSWEMTSGENPAYPHFGDANCYHFAGTNGSLDFPTMKARFYAEDQEPSWWNEFQDQVLKIQPVDPLERQLAHFENVVHGLAEPIVPAEAGRANMRVLEAIKISILDGRPITVTTLVE
jgi:predicted dehydrogenase